MVPVVPAKLFRRRRGMIEIKSSAVASALMTRINIDEAVKSNVRLSVS
jgi:hypothetical protein